MVVRERILTCVKKAFPPALKTSGWILKIMLPVSFGVLLLSWFGILPFLAALAEPLFTGVGLPGEAALVFLTSICTNLYTVIALVATLDFSVREGVILAVMCLISHNFIIESAVQKKTGSSILRMVVLRLTGSALTAAGLHLLLPEFPERLSGIAAVSVPGFRELLTDWVIDSFFLTVKIVCIITGLMVLQRLLEEFGVLKRLSRLLRPLMKLFGLPASSSFLWIVGNTVGLAYGSAIMMDYAEQGEMKPREADLLNHHLAISHSQLEDPLLFMAIGLPVWWLILPRLMLAVPAVWERRLEWVVQACFRKKN